MNFSFKGAFFNFNNGFKANNSKRSFNFSKSFFNNKYNFNILNSNQGNKFKINFGNKMFMNKLFILNQSSEIVGKVTNSRISSGVLGTMENESDSEMGQACNSPSDAMVLFGDMCLIRDECNWTCGTRLSSGPMSPVQMIQLINKSSSK
jgi:hypothetical protein